MCAYGLQAQTMTALEQSRAVNTFIILPFCGEGGQFMDDEAEDFALFDSKAVASDSCPAGLAMALAIQQSTIGETELSAKGLTSSDAASEVFQVIHAISGTTYEVTFTLDETATFQLTGELSASGALPVVFGSVDVRLLNAVLEVVTATTIQPPIEGGETVQMLDQQLSLEPGLYTFRATASTVIDAKLPPDGSGESFFDVSFGLVTLSPDLNDDGDVDFSDLLALLDAWGACESGTKCPADLDTSGEVGFADLLILLANWT